MKRYLDHDTARSILSRAMTNANLSSRRAGHPTLATGFLVDAGKQIWHEDGYANQWSFKEWWSEVHSKTKARSRFNRSETKKIGTRRHKQADQNKLINYRNTQTLRDKYRELADKFDVIPADNVLAEVGNFSTGGIRSTRSELRKEGYEFEIVSDGVRVIGRPEPQPEPEPEPVEEVTVASVLVPETQPVQVLAPTNNSETVQRLDRVIVLLEQLLKVWSE